MYRAPPTQRHRTKASAPFHDSDELSLVVVLCLLWVTSVARAVGPVLRREAFDGEASVALLVALFVPLLVGDTLITWRRRVRARGNAARTGPID